MGKIPLPLKTIREQKGWTQDIAAKKIGISPDTLFKYEQGKTYPNVKTIKKIEKAYCVSYDEIIFL